MLQMYCESTGSRREQDETIKAARKWRRVVWWQIPVPDGHPFYGFSLLFSYLLCSGRVETLLTVPTARSSSSTFEDVLPPYILSKLVKTKMVSSLYEKWILNQVKVYELRCLNQGTCGSWITVGLTLIP